MVDWDSWRKHVDYVVAANGRWFGIGDGDGAPLFTLPDPVSIGAPDQWMASEDVELTMPARDSDGQINRAAQLLVVDGITGFDASGQPVNIPETDYTLLVAMPGADGGVIRRGGVITHTVATDEDNDGMPNSITIHALNLMDVWNTIPAVSWPASWWAATPYPRDSDEAEIPYKRSWDMARVEMATRPTFTWKNGQAGFVIRRLAQESLDAAMMTQQDPDGTRWVDAPFHVVEVPETDTTPEISLEARDGMLWETVAAQAKNAGVILGARLWWPGDPAVRCWSQATSGMAPRDVDISPSVGESSRTLSYRSFEHAMIVMEVKEVH